MKQNPDFNRRLTRLVMTKCAQHNVSMEKQAAIGALLKKLFGGAMAKGKGMLGRASAGAKQLGIDGTRKAAIPAAIGGAGVGGYTLGDYAGHSRGFSAGDNAGYGRGLGEGGSTATRNLFKGLIDLQSQGAKSKTDLSSLMPKKGSAQLTWTERRKLNIKLASTILNINAIDREMAKYDVHQLQKSAAVGAHRKQRLKYAALIRQRELEKQAFLGGLARLGMKGMGVLARSGRQGIRMAANGLEGAGRYGMAAAKGVNRMGMNAARGAAPHLTAAGRQISRAGTAAARGVGNAIKANPMQGAAGAGAVGLGAGMYGGQLARGAAGMANAGIQGMGNYLNQGANTVGNAVGQAGNTVGQGLNSLYQSAMAPSRAIGDAMGTAYGNTMNFMGNARRAMGDIGGGFQQAGQRFY